MKYGLSKEAIEKLEKDGILYAYGHVLCLACYQANECKVYPEMYYGTILTTHLNSKHPEIFKSEKHPVAYYKKIYPGAKIQSKETLQQIYKKDPDQEYKEISINKINKEVALAKGIGNYSQDQLLLIHKKMLKLADIYENEGNFSAMLDALKAAEKAISNTSPSRGNIEGQQPTTEATADDKKALAEMDELLPYIKQDVVNRVVSKKVEDGWKNPTG